MTQRILVTGATGRTGRLVVEGLLGLPETPIVRVLARTAEQERAGADRGLETALGDVRDDTTSWADAAMRDVDTVISAMGGTPFKQNNLWRVDYEGTLRLLAAARTAGVGHYVFISTMGLRRERSILHPLSILFYPKLLAEDAIRRSGIDYTILRPGGLVDRGEAEPEGARNTREQVAEACLGALARPDARGKTWEMSAERRAEPGADPIFGVAVEP
ncbi:MAG TPA: SDR family oxidoreductase [Herpetosiphonaceae bacterium]|nr:SDR family oxidoreductase [Herpetosiphonaceae bacterium]